MSAEEAVAIETAAGRLFGMWHESAGEPRAALVFCHPLFEEKKASHHILVQAARAFAASGVPVLRFDYWGCGDSPGEFASAGLEEWLSDIRAALAWVRRRLGERCPVGLLGLRFGGTLAALWAENDAAVGMLILWEPILSGMDYIALDLRKKLVKEMIQHGRALESRDSLIGRLEAEQGIDMDGYAVTPALYRSLRAVDLRRNPKRWQGPLLVVQVSAHGGVEESVRRFAETYAGAERDVQAVRGEPFWNLVGIAECPAVIERTAEWLTQRWRG